MKPGGWLHNNLQPIPRTEAIAYPLHGDEDGKLYIANMMHLIHEELI
jgi:hypothetical protein